VSSGDDVHLLLTDRLTCPRCGPAFGLILLADRMEDRRVEEGTLGCPNCRDAFPVRDGFADLRAPPRGELPEGRAGGTTPPDPGEAERIVALLGIHRGPGTVAMVGRPAVHAGSVAEAVDDLQVVAVDADTRHWPDRAFVSRIAASPGLPFFSGMLRGVVIDGTLGRALLSEGARVVAPKSRIVVTDASGEAEEVLEEAGLEILAAESGTVVATRA
jgi:uncharacterized protein YbaR (Trm112 family)